MTELIVEVPRKLRPLIDPARYKGAHGGRGGGKSHFFAEQVVIRCLVAPTRVVCIREVQNSIKESVRQLLVDKITALGLEYHYQILESEIRGRNSSLIIFRGMQSYNAANIKSLEGYDIAWVEEAQTLSDLSLRMLTPTIRKEGSELWFSWNPRHDTDPVDKFFRQQKRDGAVCVEVNWQDNPWFPDVLRREMEAAYVNDPEMAEHVWGGAYEFVGEAAYYARLILAAEREGRIGSYPAKPNVPVVTSWDIGVDDYTAIWFWQHDGLKATVVDYYETSGDGADEIVRTALPEHNLDAAARQDALAKLGRAEPFRYSTHFLPHDVANREWGAGGRSRIQTLQELGLRGIRRGAAMKPEDRINAARQLLPRTLFNDTPRVQVGLRRLRMYQRKRNEQLGIWQGPLHDEASHGADAFGEFAVNQLIAPLREVPKPAPTELALEIGDDGRLRSNMSVKEIIEMRRRKRERD